MGKGYAGGGAGCTMGPERCLQPAAARQAAKASKGLQRNSASRSVAAENALGSQPVREKRWGPSSNCHDVSFGSGSGGGLLLETDAFSPVARHANVLLRPSHVPWKRSATAAPPSVIERLLALTERAHGASRARMHT